MEAETHKEARGKNYSDFINENTDKKQGSNELYMGPKIQQPKPGLRIPHYDYGSEIIKLSCCLQYLFPQTLRRKLFTLAFL